MTPTPVGRHAPRSTRAVHALAAALAAGLVATVAVGCGSPADGKEGRPITTEESQLLALARFKNFDAGARKFDVQLTDGGHQLTVQGYFDYRTRVGYATLLDGMVPNSLVAWDSGTIAVHSPGPTDIPPLPVPDAGDALGPQWVAGALDPSASPLHAALAVVAELGNDRPDNPLLLQQGGALWLREDDAHGTPVTVFTGPTGLAGEEPAESRIRYWVAEDGLLMRADVQLGAAWVSFDFFTADDVAFDFAVAPADAAG